MTNLTFDDVSRALRNAANRSSFADANRVLEQVAGTSALREVAEADYAAVIAALSERKASVSDSPNMLDASGQNIDPVKAWARWNAAGRGRSRMGDAS